ncbi:hypothetical protein JKP88DRAFT_326724 [Tribonema minus]|uniref:Uncharacterized protein n=1 Tax=Tribonema minus TaxID=303371 RepID=A0A835YYM4_9STRA|nr:hypothetical protein JKP88DRAFT_326724 [Tribonema minus]
MARVSIGRAQMAVAHANSSAQGGTCAGISAQTARWRAPLVKPSAALLKQLGDGALHWNPSTSDRAETLVVCQLLRSPEAWHALTRISLSGGDMENYSARKRSSVLSAARRSSRGGAAATAGGVAPKAKFGAAAVAQAGKDPTGEAALLDALSAALPKTTALESLELDGLRRSLGSAAAARAAAASAAGSAKRGGGGGDAPPAAPRGVAALARGLRANASLRALSVRNVSLADARALGALCSAVAAHPRIAALALPNCNVRGADGARIVGAVIRAHSNRRDGLSWSAGLRRARPRGAATSAAPAALARAGLLSLDVSRNRLGDAGAAELARALRGDAWLVALSLAATGLSDDAAAALQECLSVNQELCLVLLEHNPRLSPAAIAALDATLHERIVPRAAVEDAAVAATLDSWGFILGGGDAPSLADVEVGMIHVEVEGTPPPPSRPFGAAADHAPSPPLELSPHHLSALELRDTSGGGGGSGNGSQQQRRRQQHGGAPAVPQKPPRYSVPRGSGSGRSSAQAVADGGAEGKAKRRRRRSGGKAPKRGAGSKKQRSADDGGGGGCGGEDADALHGVLGSFLSDIPAAGSSEADEGPVTAGDAALVAAAGVAAAPPPQRAAAPHAEAAAATPPPPPSFPGFADVSVGSTDVETVAAQLEAMVANLSLQVDRLEDALGTGRGSAAAAAADSSVGVGDGGGGGGAAAVGSGGAAADGDCAAPAAAAADGSAAAAAAADNSGAAAGGDAGGTGDGDGGSGGSDGDAARGALHAAMEGLITEEVTARLRELWQLG